VTGVQTCALPISFITLTVLITLGILATLGAYAFQSDVDEVQNNLRSGALVVNIAESTFVSGAGIIAGEEYTGDKQIDIVSSGTYPGVVRVMVSAQIREDAGGDDLLLDASEVLFVNLNPDWVDGGDGYYYYTKVIEPAQTVAFCDNIELGTLGPDHDTFKLTIDVLAEAHYLTDSAYPHERAWWNLGASDSGTTTIETIRATIKSAIDTYVALHWI
jgi:hypothetical protein